MAASINAERRCRSSGSVFILPGIKGQPLESSCVALPHGAALSSALAEGDVMPTHARSLCNYPGCRAFSVKDGRCDAHQYERLRVYSRPPWHVWYNRREWIALRDKQLNKEPLCYYCAQRGQTTVATVVDHEIPHNGNWTLFMDPDNLRSSCKRCHDQKTAAEDGGFGNKRRKVWRKTDSSSGTTHT